jgi:hypothetical protein
MAGNEKPQGPDDGKEVADSEMIINCLETAIEELCRTHYVGNSSVIGALRVMQVLTEEDERIAFNRRRAEEEAQGPKLH